MLRRDRSGKEVARRIRKIEAFGTMNPLPSCAEFPTYHGAEERKDGPAPVLLLCEDGYALPTGSATNLIWSPDFTRVRIVCLPSRLASCTALRTSEGLATDLPP